MAEKQVIQVLEEFENGPATSRDIADALGFSVKTVSSYISQLHELGMIRRIGTEVRSGAGEVCRIYELNKQGICPGKTPNSLAKVARMAIHAAGADVAQPNKVHRNQPTKMTAD